MYDLAILTDGTLTDGRTVDAAHSAEPVSILRGASVGADTRLVARMLAGLGFVAVTVATLVLFVAAVHKNDQINRLHDEGANVEMTVTGCSGLVGGSGSNLVGYQCRGTFVLSDRRYDEEIPGSIFRAPGAKFQAVVVKGDPGLVAPRAVVETEQASARPFVLPATLLLALVVATAALALRKRRASSRRSPSGSGRLARLTRVL